VDCWRKIGAVGYDFDPRIVPNVLEGLGGDTAGRSAAHGIHPLPANRFGGDNEGP
jgi:hypothetical protein